MRPFLLFGAATILFATIVLSLFFGSSKCLENGFGCISEPVNAYAEEDLSAEKSKPLSISDRILDPAQCPFFSRAGASKIFEFDPLRKRTLQPIKMEDLRDIAHLSLHLSLSLPVDTSAQATLPDQLAIQFHRMSECQLCDWAIFAGRPSVLDSIPERKVLANQVAEIATEILGNRGVELKQCSTIMARE